MTVAPTFTEGDFATAVQTVSASGASITVYGFVLANADTQNARTVTFSATDATAGDIMVIVLAASTTIPWDMEWRADKGLKLTCSAADADVTYTVLHSSTVT